MLLCLFMHYLRISICLITGNINFDHLVNKVIEQFIYFKVTISGQVRYYGPVVPVIQEAEMGGPPEPRSSGPAYITQ